MAYIGLNFFFYLCWWHILAVGIDADLFTMKVNHGGAIVVVDGVATYKDGEIEYFDLCYY